MQKQSIPSVIGQSTDAQDDSSYIFRIAVRNLNLNLNLNISAAFSTEVHLFKQPRFNRRNNFFLLLLLLPIASASYRWTDVTILFLFFDLPEPLLNPCTVPSMTPFKTTEALPGDGCSGTRLQHTSATPRRGMMAFLWPIYFYQHINGGEQGTMCRTGSGTCRTASSTSTLRRTAPRYTFLQDTVSIVDMPTDSNMQLILCHIST
jgi:hypothetical protein